MAGGGSGAYMNIQPASEETPVNKITGANGVLYCIKHLSYKILIILYYLEPVHYGPSSFGNRQ